VQNRGASRADSIRGGVWGGVEDLGKGTPPIGDKSAKWTVPPCP